MFRGDWPGWLAVALIGAALALAGCGSPGDLAAQVAQQGPGDVPGAGNVAPDFAVPLLDGDSLQLSDLRGRPAILYFWATWCGSCTFDMPVMEAIYQQQADTGLVILTVNVGQSEATVRDFVTQGGFTFLVGLDGRMDIGRTYRLMGFPSTYLIDREGVIRNVRVGPISRETLLERLALIQ